MLFFSYIFISFFLFMLLILNKLTANTLGRRQLQVSTVMLISIFYQILVFENIFNHSRITSRFLILVGFSKPS